MANMITITATIKKIRGREYNEKKYMVAQSFIVNYMWSFNCGFCRISDMGFKSRGRKKRKADERSEKER